MYAQCTYNHTHTHTHTHTHIAGIRTDRLAEFSWRTFHNPSSPSGAGPDLKLDKVVNQPCHTRLPGSRLSTVQASSISLGQGWILGVDKTIRVAAHTEYCLDIDGASKAPGTPLITYPCNSVSINNVHNQQFEYYGGNNHTIRSVMTGLCVDLGTTTAAPATMQG